METTNETIQLIFVVETTKKAKIDNYYIDEILDKFYFINENKISYVYMSGKHNYNHQKTSDNIKKIIKDYKMIGRGHSYVIYVLDKDRNALSYNDATFEKEVECFCHENGFKLIWFVDSIEDVMLSGRVKDKKKSAIEFVSKNKISDINKIKLSAANNVNKRGKSNILTI